MLFCNVSRLRIIDLDLRIRHLSVTYIGLRMRSTFCAGATTGSRRTYKNGVLQCVLRVKSESPLRVE